MNRQEKQEREKKSAKIIVGAIVTTLLCFMLFMSGMVIKSFRNPSNLVSESYYQDGIVYQDDIDRLNAASKLSYQPVIEAIDGSVRVVWPQGLELPTDLRVTIYRPSNPSGDSSSKVTFDSARRWQKKIGHGRWNIALDWQNNGIDCRIENKLFL